MTPDSGAPPVSEYELQALRGVSRSFALTIPELPKELRKIVTSAYLLCRIADTIEDEAGLSLAQKRRFFGDLLGAVEGRLPADRLAQTLHPRLSDCTLPAEKELVRNTARVIEAVFGFSDRQQAAIRRCLSVMADGMQHFQAIKQPQGLRDLAQLESYCYHVAGVVGELLTELFCEYSTAIARQRDALYRLAASFGQGLQMTNILKDLWDDQQRGVSWLPRDVFLRRGFDLADLTPNRHVITFGDGIGDLVGIAHGHLQNALSYTLLIPRKETGVRKFCLWAIGMAVLTLANINHKRNYTSGLDVKISKRSARTVILLSNAALGSNHLLKVLFALAARNLPPADPRRALQPSGGGSTAGTGHTLAEAVGRQKRTTRARTQARKDFTPPWTEK